MLFVADRTIVSRVVLCRSFFSKFRGLQFRKQLVDEAYVFVFDSMAKRPFHMFWVFFPIDVLWLDSAQRVVHVSRGVRPFVFHVSAPVPSQFVIEVAAGVADDVKIGDVVKWSM